MTRVQLAGLIRCRLRGPTNHGNTVKNTEYSFLPTSSLGAAICRSARSMILPTDPPMVTKVGELNAGRLPQILGGVANIHFAVEQMKKIKPNADLLVTMVGHSMGGDISMYFAKHISERDQEWW